MLLQSRHSDGSVIFSKPNKTSRIDDCRSPDGLRKMRSPGNRPMRRSTYWTIALCLNSSRRFLRHSPPSRHSRSRGFATKWKHTSKRLRNVWSRPMSLSILDGSRFAPGHRNSSVISRQVATLGTYRTNENIGIAMSSFSCLNVFAPSHGRSGTLRNRGAQSEFRNAISCRFSFSVKFI